MAAELWPLAGAAFTIGCVHTLLGPDHYLPFVAMSRAGSWSTRKTLIITWLCGLGHVGSSVLLGLLGIALGLAVDRLEGFEESRGAWAARLLIGFGLAYLAWGVVRAVRNRPHSHLHAHADGVVHSHSHHHHAEHAHVHPAAAKPEALTPWILFTIFFFGPCEPLIPLVMFSASEKSVWGVVLVTLLFTLATLVTMTVMVRLMIGGFSLLKLSSWGRYGHAMAGGIVLACGLAVKFGL
jgi:sulfite exporter TauE/SafE